MAEPTTTLLESVLAAPDDVTCRRVYADALAEADDPRGEFIQVQCDLAELSPAHPRWAGLVARQRELLDLHGATWRAPYADFVVQPKFTRGMLSDAYVTTKKFLAASNNALASEPLTRLRLRGVTQAAASTLANRPELARIRELQVRESTIGAAGATALLSRHLPQLRSLDLYQAGLDNQAMAPLREVAPQLEVLDLSGNRLSADALTPIIGARTLTRLTKLSLKWLARAGTSSDYLAGHLALPALTHLDLANNELTDASLEVLEENHCFRRLRGLALENNRLGAGALGTLAKLPDLVELDLSTNTITSAGCAALAGSLPRLRTLRLDQCKIAAPGLAALCSGGFAQLSVLTLGYCDLDAASLAPLTNIDWPISELSLWANQVGDDGARALAQARFTRCVRSLSLGGCGIGDRGAEAIARAHWPVLERLVFRGGSISEVGARAIANAETMPMLREITFSDLKIPKRAFAPLRKRGVEVIG